MINRATLYLLTSDFFFEKVLENKSKKIRSFRLFVRKFLNCRHRRRRRRRRHRRFRRRRRRRR